MEEVVAAVTVIVIVAVAATVSFSQCCNTLVQA